MLIVNAWQIFTFYPGILDLAAPDSLVAFIAEAIVPALSGEWHRKIDIRQGLYNVTARDYSHRV